MTKRSSSWDLSHKRWYQITTFRLHTCNFDNSIIFQSITKPRLLRFTSTKTEKNPKRTTSRGTSTTPISHPIFKAIRWMHGPPMTSSSLPFWPPCSVVKGGVNWDVHSNWKLKNNLDGGNSNIFYFDPYLGKITILTNIFQVGWNNQLEIWNLPNLHWFASIRQFRSKYKHTHTIHV